MRRSKTLLGVMFLWLVPVALPAAADRVVIEYAITSGQATIQGDFLANITGNTFALSYLVDVTSGDPNLKSCATTNVIPGYVIQEGGTLLLSLDAAFTSTYPYFDTRGRVVAPTGPLTPSSCPVNGVARLNGATAPISLVGDQTVTCFGTAPYCGYFYYTPGVPAVLDVVFRLSAPGGFIWNKQNGTGMMHGVYMTESIGGFAYSGIATVSFVGQEIARTFVPEPSASLLGAASLVTMGGLAIYRRKARAGLSAVMTNTQES